MTSTSVSTTAARYKFLSEENGALCFRISHIDVSVANALRRTLLTDIPIHVMRQEDCTILVNTGRLSNEILKHRLSLIPVHVPISETIDGDVEVNVQAEDTLRYVTTEDFKRPAMFPKNVQTQDFIEFARLRPKLTETMPGEQLHFVAKFSVGTARENSAFNVVSKCAYQNTPSESEAAQVWEREKAGFPSTMSATEVSLRKKDFMCLDAQRHFVVDSFDFIVKSIGIYTNVELLHKACVILQEKILALYENLECNVFVRRSESVSMENCYDITLVNEDYTLGNLLAHLLLTTYYDNPSKTSTSQQLSFCGFKKEHPHDDDSTLRLAFEEPVEEAKVRECVRNACNKAHVIFERIGGFFSNGVTSSKSV